MISQRPTRLILRPFVGIVLAMLAGLLASMVSARQADGSLSVTTDASSYAHGDPVTVTVVNGTTTSITPQGGIVCQGSPRPFGVQRLDDAGNWQDLTFPRLP